MVTFGFLFFYISMCYTYKDTEIRLTYVMNHKVRKSSFAESTYLMYIAFMINGIIGALYYTPFLAMIGHEGFYVYDSAYAIFSLFLDLSTSGIPVAMSMIVSEYNSLGMYASKEKAFKIGRYIILGFSVCSFLILQFFARDIGYFYLPDITDSRTGERITDAIRVVSFSLLIIPMMALKRGYLQGHQLFVISSRSQLIEQMTRITVILTGAFVTIKVLGYSVYGGVLVSLWGVTISGLITYYYLTKKSSYNEELFIKEGEGERVERTRTIIRKIVVYCVIISIVSMSVSIYNIVNKKLIMVALTNLNYGSDEIKVILNNAIGLIPKIGTIVISLSLAMTSSIAPHIAGNYARQDYKGVNDKLKQVVSIVLVIAVPMALGIILLAPQVYYVFFGLSDYGPPILRIAIAFNVISCTTAVFSTALQSMNHGKHVCFYTILSILLNITMDIPLIYLLHNLGLPAYLGANVSNIIAELLLLLLQIRTLYAVVNFDYRRAFTIFKQIAMPLGVMAVVVLIMKFVIPVPLTLGRFRVLLLLFVYALVGAGVYFALCYKIGALKLVFDEEMISSITKRFRKEKNDEEN